MLSLKLHSANVNEKLRQDYLTDIDHLDCLDNLVKIIEVCQKSVILFDFKVEAEFKNRRGTRERRSDTAMRKRHQFEQG